MSATTRDTEPKKALTFTEKEARKYRKKARQAEEKFKTTKDTSWLTERDKFNDKVIELLRNQVTNVNNNKKKKKKQKKNLKKTDDQLLNEAISQNRRERNEREKVAKEKEKKKQALSSRRAELKEMMREKEEQTEKMNQEKMEKNKEQEEAEKEFKENFINEYLEKNPGRNHSDAHKEFVKEYKKMMEQLVFKNNIIQHLMREGMSVEEAGEQFDQMMGQMIAAEGPIGREGEGGLVKRLQQGEGPTITEM